MAVIPPASSLVLLNPMDGADPGIVNPTVVAWLAQIASVAGGGGGGGGASNITAVGGNAVTTFLPAQLTAALPAGANSIGLVAQGAAAVVTAGWPFINGELGDVTGTFTNATQTNSVSTASSFASIDGYDTVTLSINGTYGVASAVFEATDDGGTTWYPIQAVRADSGTTELGYTSLTNTNRVWFVSTQGFDAFRVRSTAVTSGTANIRLSISSAPVTAGTVAMLNGIVNGQQAAAASLPVTLSNENVQDSNITGQGVQTVANNNILLAVAGTGALDTNGYRSAKVGVTVTGTVTSGVVTFEGSDDNVNFNSLIVTDVSTASANVVSSMSPTTGAFRNFYFSLSYRYIRFRISTVIGGGGSIQAFTFLSQVPYGHTVMSVVSPTAANFNATITGTLTSLTPGTAAGNLGKAEDAASASGDTGVFALAVRRDAGVISASANGDYNEIAVNKYGAVQTAPFGSTAKTFRAVVNVALAAAATDIFIIPGNATNTVYVTRVTVSGIQTTAGLVDVLLIKRSAANTGTSAAATSVPLDASDAAAVSLPISYTANPTPGAAVGTIDRAYVNAGPLATGVVQTVKDFNFGAYGKPVILSGVAQGLAVNLNGATVTGGTFTVVVEWLEVA